MAQRKPGSTSKLQTVPHGRAEFEILKASHKFLHEEEKPSSSASWDDQLARKYYDSLYREFAVCELKHYKSGNFALRWRTEEEVLSGAGESSCANTRCAHHSPSKGSSPPSLTTLELPFQYEEHSEQKSALVKVVLCKKCVGKLMWKRRKEKEKESESEKGTETKDLEGVRDKERPESDKGEKIDRKHRTRNSRSRSPRRSPQHESPSRRRYLYSMSRT